MVGLYIMENPHKMKDLGVPPHILLVRSSNPQEKNRTSNRVTAVALGLPATSSLPPALMELGINFRRAEREKAPQLAPG